MVPGEEQCEYCKRKHEGKCKGGKKGCLYFYKDPEGKEITSNIKLRFKLYQEIPQVGKWDYRWEISGKDTKIKINRIDKLEWDTRAGCLIVYGLVSYWVDEYKKEEESNKVIRLKVIK